MAESSDYITLQDKSKLLSVISIIAGVLSFAFALVILFTGIVKEWFGFDVYTLAVIPYFLVVIFSFASFTYGFLAAKMAGEKEEKQLLEKDQQRKTTFDTDEDARFTAERTFNNFRKIAPSVLANLGFVIILVVLYFFWKFWSGRVGTPIPVKPLQSAFLATVLMAINIFAAAFCLGQARAKEFRWLGPVGAWLVVGFLINLMSAITAIMYDFGYTRLDYYFRNIVFYVLIVLAIEFFINFIIEFYRPRTKAVEKPIHESRLLALFTEPGGLVRNIADTLDYQFGFKVSGTWIYTFLEKAIVPLVLIWIIILWLTTIVTEVGPDEVGIRERFGEVVSKQPLPSNLYFKLPWPFGKISRYPIYRIQEVVVGPEMKDKGTAKEKRPEVVLWTKSHYAKESRYLVAALKEKTDKDTKEVPVSFLSASFPIQYRIKYEDVYDFAYKYENSPKILKNVAEKVVTKYLASIDLIKIMSVDRQKTITELQGRIQKEVDNMDLGVEIVVVNFHDSHPPVEKVAPAYQDVIGAQEEKEAKILAAKAEREKINSDKEIGEKKAILEAEAYKTSTIKVAKADSERFAKQLSAYNQMPGMFKLRTYLDFLENDTQQIRKYIMSNSFKSEVYNINLEEKTRFDLIDSDISDLSGQ